MSTVEASRLESARRDHEDTGERLRRCAIEAVQAGMSEVQAARLAGVSRPTLRKWLGKS